MAYPIVLTIAGSDPSGGAGIQADIKTICALKGYASSVITALTAQNTQGVQGVLSIDPDFIAAQCYAVFSDLDVRAVKVGMLHSIECIEVVAMMLARFKPPIIILDPVMVATSGDSLLNCDAMAVLVAALFPQTTLITPNIPEAAALLNIAPEAVGDDISGVLAGLQQLGAKNTLLKGGHGQGRAAIDYLALAQHIHPFSLARIYSPHTHGTGCTLSSAIATFMARGDGLYDAVQKSKRYVHQGICAATELTIGQGRGPLHHFHGRAVDEASHTTAG